MPDTSTQSSSSKGTPSGKILVDEDLFRKLTDAGDALARSLNGSPGFDVMRGFSIREWNEAKAAVRQGAVHQ